MKKLAIFLSLGVSIFLLAGCTLFDNRTIEEVDGVTDTGPIIIQDIDEEKNVIKEDEIEEDIVEENIVEENNVEKDSIEENNIEENNVEEVSEDFVELAEELIEEHKKNVTGDKLTDEDVQFMHDLIDVLLNKEK